MKASATITPDSLGSTSSRDRIATRPIADHQPMNITVMRAFL